MKIIFPKRLIFILPLLMHGALSAQVYNMPGGTQVSCSGMFYDGGGSSGNYSNNQAIATTFQSANGNRLKFTFSSFLLNSDGIDYLEIFDGPDSNYPSLGRYYYNSGPGIIESTGEALCFYFYSNSTYSNAGWVASITCTTPALPVYSLGTGPVSTCEGVFTDAQGLAANYLPNLDQTTSFCGSSGFLVFDFTHFNLATDDTLFAFDGDSIDDPLIGCYTGGHLPEKVFSRSGPCLTFRFKSGNLYQGSGWRALISCSATEPTLIYNHQPGVRYTCSGTYYDDGGTGYYWNAASKTETFISPNGNRLKFTFSVFTMNSDGYDYLEIFDGPSTAFPSLGRFSYGGNPGIIESTGSALTFYFYSNGTYVSTGWVASISCTTPALAVYPLTSGLVTGCEGLFCDPQGRAADYQPNQNQSMTFCGSSGVLVFDFTHFDLATDDTLFIFDGDSVGDPLIGKYTGSQLPEKVCSRSGSCLSFRLVSGSLNQGDGWQAVWSCSSTEPSLIYTHQPGIRYTCSGNYYDDGGTGNYWNNDSKTETFVSSNGNRLRFTFSSFSLNSDGYDYLEIFDGPGTAYPSLGRYYYGGNPGIIESTGTALTFFFYSNSTYNSSGWAASISCTTPALTVYPISSGSITACDGIFCDGQGQSAGYLPNLDQTMTFCAPSGYLVFDFLQFELALDDTLFAFDGPNTGAQLIGKYTGTQIPEKICSRTGSCVTFRFKSGNMNQDDGWRAVISCASTLPSLTYAHQPGVRYTCTGTYVDDGFSGNYGISISKTETFMSPDGNRLRFTFSSFTMNSDGYDYLEIFDGPTTSYPLIGRYYYGDNPGIIESTGNALSFYFYSNSTYTASGWTASISCTTPALPVFPMASGSITGCSGVFCDSPGLAAPYPANEDKTMTFCGSTGYLVFEFLQFDLATDDTLFAYDGESPVAPLIGKYTGNQLPEKIYSLSGTCVTFRFKSGNLNQGAGWKAILSCSGTPPERLFAHQSGARYTCSGTYYDGGLTGNYPNSVSKTETFHSTSGLRLRFSFSAFTMNSDGYDYLEIFDGPSTNYPSLGRYGYGSTPGVVESTGSSLTFYFYSNSSYNASGWNASISCTTPPLPVYSMGNLSDSVCQAVFFDQGGPTQYYSANANDLTTFTSTTGTYLQFEFSHFSVSAGDTLMAYDGVSANAPLIGKYWGSQLPEKICSRLGSSVSFRFVSNSTSQSEGWRALISCVATPPNPVYLMQPGVRSTCSGSFYDEGGPSSVYPGLSSKTMTFVSSTGGRLQFTFSSFYTESGYDRLYVYDGPDSSYPLIGTYQGSLSAFTVTSTGSILTFYFSSDNAVHYSGWTGSISCLASPVPNVVMQSGTDTLCTAVFFDSGGPNASYPANQSLIQTLTSEEQNFLLVDFTHFDLAAGDSLFAYDGPGPQSPLIGIYSGNQLPEIIYSRLGSTLTFRFVSDGTNQGFGWRALVSCSSTPPSLIYKMQNGVRYTCGGSFCDDGGPGQVYSNYLSRTMTFVSATGERLQFSFDGFSTESGYDKLYVYDGPTSAWPLVGIFSGSSGPGVVLSSGTALTFYFVSDYNTNFTGWSASIQCAGPPQPVFPMAGVSVTACQGLFTDAGGPAADYPEGMDQTMTFCSGSADRISLQFTHFGISAGDTLFAYDGSTTSAPLMGKYWGNTLPENISSQTGTCITLRFVSNATMESAGWVARLSCLATPPDPIFRIAEGERTTCHGTFVDDGGTGSYSNGISRFMTFHAGNGGRLQFQFTSFSTESGYDRLYIYDGPDNTFPLLGSYSGTSGPGTIQSTGPDMSFYFNSDYSSVFAGWQANITCLPGIEPLAATISAGSVSCPSGTDGMVEVQVTSGVSPYSYQWNTGATGSGLSGLAAGMYQCTVVDGMGRSMVLSAPVDQPQPFSLILSPSDVVNGLWGSIGLIAQGGSPPYGFLWSNGSSLEDPDQLPAGTYGLTLTDAHGCQVTGTATVLLRSQLVHLNTGWNLFSTFIQPGNPSVPAVMAPIVLYTLLMKNENGAIYWPEYGVNQIGSFVLGKAYQVKTLAATDLLVGGIPANPQTTPLSLPTGWSLAGYLRQQPMPIANALTPILGQVQLVKDGLGNIYWPQYNVNLIGQMNPGKGYQIKVSQPVQFNYPAN